MLLLIFCIVINAFIGIIFKLFTKYEINLLQAIVINYFTCLATASVMKGQFALPPDLSTQPWFFYALFLGLIFVLTFNIMGRAVREAGVMSATIFQKMSLIAPTLAAVIAFGESFGILKFLGILLAIAALFMIQWPRTRDRSAMKNGLQWLILTFLASCFIDTCLFFIEAYKIAPNGDIQFVASLFFFAGCFGLLALIYKVLWYQMKIQLKNIIAGILLGIPNFFSIYLLLVLLSQDWEGSVLFPINNVGVLTLSSIAGILFFREAFSWLKLGGFVLATLAIILIMNA